MMPRARSDTPRFTSVRTAISSSDVTSHCIRGPLCLGKTDVEQQESRIMSGWLRIGVVLSVLWIVGQPIYFFINHNNHAWERRQGCLDLQSTIYSELSYDQLWDKCNEMADFMPLSYFVTGHDAPLFWIIFV